MSVEKAKAYHAGKAGAKRLNCAQAIVAAFMEDFSLSEETVKLFEKYGGGRAPGGECGALSAAKFILEGSKIPGGAECEKVFSSHAGSTKCKDIRAMKRLSCSGCVEKAAEFIHKKVSKR